MDKIQCTCIEAYTSRKLRDPDCCACSCDYNDLVDEVNNLRAENEALKLDVYSQMPKYKAVRDAFIDGVYWYEQSNYVNQLKLDKAAHEYANQAIEGYEKCLKMPNDSDLDIRKISEIEQLRTENEALRKDNEQLKSAYDEWKSQWHELNEDNKALRDYIASLMSTMPKIKADAILASVADIGTNEPFARIVINHVKDYAERIRGVNDE